MEPIADMVKQLAATIKAFFLPKASVIVPATMHPNMVPNNADETTQPNVAGDS